MFGTEAALLAVEAWLSVISPPRGSVLDTHRAGRAALRIQCVRMFCAEDAPLCGDSLCEQVDSRLKQAEAFVHLSHGRHHPSLHDRLPCKTGIDLVSSFVQNRARRNVFPRDWSDRIFGTTHKEICHTFRRICFVVCTVTFSCNARRLHCHRHSQNQNGQTNCGEAATPNRCRRTNLRVR